MSAEACFQPPRGALGPQFARHVPVGPDRHRRRCARHLRPVRARGGRHLQLPRLRERFRRARRVQDDLHLLLDAARPVGHKVRSRRRHRPPPFRQPRDRKVVIVDDRPLVADQPQDRDAPSRLDVHLDQTLRRPFVLGPAQQQRGDPRRRRRARGRHVRAHRRRRDGAHAPRGGRRRRGRRGRGHPRGRQGRVGILLHRSPRRRPTRRRRLDRGDERRRLPPQVLAARAEVGLVGVLAPAAGAGPPAPPPSAVLSAP